MSYHKIGELYVVEGFASELEGRVVKLLKFLPTLGNGPMGEVKVVEASDMGFDRTYKIELKHLKYISIYPKKEKVMKKNKVEKYSFTVGTLFNIDGPGIRKDLSYAQPLAIVTINDKMFAVVHDSIPTKLGLCEGGYEMLQEVIAIIPTMDFEDLYSIEDIKAVGKLQKLLNRIKAAPYLEKVKESGTVTVQKINL